MRENGKLKDNELICFCMRSRNSVTSYVAAYDLARCGLRKQIFVKESLGFGVFRPSAVILFAHFFLVVNLSRK